MHAFRASIVGLIAMFLPLTATALPVVPGAQGFGTETVAGRGGAVIVVDTLAPTGEGSLQACVATPGPRTCVFAVSGTIDIGGQMMIGEPFLTLAGQTAPSPGVTIRGPVGIRTHDVLIQHLRFRAGDVPEVDAIGITSDPQGEGTFNIVLDHITASWANDENISAYPGPPDMAGQPGYTVTDFTLSNSLSSEGLTFAPGHSMGFLAARPGLLNVSVIGNMFLHNGGRNPKLGNGNFVIANNLIYNWGSTATTMGSQAGVFDGAVIANAWEIGPDVASTGKPPINISTGNPGSNTLYIADNLFAGEIAGDQWSLVVVEEATVAQEPMLPAWLPDLALVDAEELGATLAQCSGARPLDRDPVDERVVASYLDGNGSLTDCVEASSPACSTPEPRTPPGGWPDLAENTIELDIPADPAGDDDDDGYTNLEEWLHDAAAQVECRGSGVDPTGGDDGADGSSEGDDGTDPDSTGGDDGGAATSGGGSGGGAATDGGGDSGEGTSVLTGDGSGGANDDSADGCGCRQSSAPRGAGLALMLMLLARRRRQVA
ncbi:MAG: hypothetical protein AAF721_22845 [Myxococcota bacterium]